MPAEVRTYIASLFGNNIPSHYLSTPALNQHHNTIVAARCCLPGKHYWADGARALGVYEEPGGGLRWSAAVTGTVV
jgi:hypothetical protein